MWLNSLFLMIAAIVPTVVLCVYVFKKDRVEKEPLGLLLKLFLLGVVSCSPAACGEAMLGDVFASFYKGVIRSFVVTDGIGYLYYALYALIGVALVEEGCKWFFMLRFTKKDKEFNCLFDGIIYAVFISLGFATLEIIMYVVDSGWITAIQRAVLAVPGHAFCGVMMGYYYSRWRIFKEAAEIEEKYIKRGFIERKVGSFPYKENKRLSIIVPVLMHGAYDFCCFVNEAWSTVAFYVLVIFMYIYCFGKIEETSRKDAPIEDYVIRTLAKTYPELPDRIEAERQMMGIN